MLKWMLTSDCPRKCEYCIVRNIRRKEELDLELAELILVDLYKSSKTIMLTGGEPSVSKQFGDKVKLANKIFDEVYITTQNREMLGNPEISSYFDAITFSSHFEQLPVVQIKTPVYLSILDSEFSYELFEDAVNKGFKGLTINEEQRAGKTFDDSVLTNLKYNYAKANTDKNNVKRVAAFSIRINRAGKCTEDGEVILFPDLDIIDNFSEYL